MELWLSIYLWWLAAAGVAFVLNGIADGLNKESTFHKLFKLLGGLILWAVLIVFIAAVATIPFKIIF